jgi:hypothetical protein
LSARAGCWTCQTTEAEYRSVIDLLRNVVAVFARPSRTLSLPPRAFCFATGSSRPNCAAIACTTVGDWPVEACTWING